MRISGFKQQVVRILVTEYEGQKVIKCRGFSVKESTHEEVYETLRKAVEDNHK